MLDLKGAAKHKHTNLMQSGFATFPSPFQSQEHSLHQSPDPYSPEVFKQNIQLVQAHVERLQTLARSALTGVYHAYHQSINPAQTNADIASLRQALAFVTDTMRQTGVGALPLLPLSATEHTVPTEQQMMEDATLAVQAQYEKIKRIQEAATIAASVLSAQDPGARPAASAPK